MAVIINYGAMFINTVSDGSGIFYGENVQQGWNSSDKINTSSAITGYGDVVANQMNMINDIDILDQQSNFVNTNATPAPQILKCT